MGGRFDVFHSLETEKQQRILKAALVEFATKGFKYASTNAIAENAQIGKGMLFYYFGSKEELFDFLCEYAIEFVRNQYVSRYQVETGDFLERYKALTTLKRWTMSEFPEVIGFFESFFKAENAPYFGKYSEEFARIRRSVYDKIYDGVDYSLFREDVDGKTVVKYMKWLLESYEKDTTERFKRGEMDLSDDAVLSAEWEKYYAFTDDLRRIFYKG